MNIMNDNLLANNLPKMVSIRAAASTGIMNENAIRVLVKQNRIPYIMSGKKVLINYTRLVQMLDNLG